VLWPPHKMTSTRQTITSLGKGRGGGDEGGINLDKTRIREENKTDGEHLEHLGQKKGMAKPRLVMRADYTEYDYTKRKTYLGKGADTCPWSEGIL